MQLLSDMIKGNYVALKRTTEDRKEWQKLLQGKHPQTGQRAANFRLLANQ